MFLSRLHITGLREAYHYPRHLEEYNSQLLFLFFNISDEAFRRFGPDLAARCGQDMVPDAIFSEVTCYQVPCHIMLSDRLCFVKNLIHLRLRNFVTLSDLIRRCRFM